MALECCALRAHAHAHGGTAVQQAVLQALWSLAHHRPGCIEALQAYGGLHLCLAALRQRPADAGVQEWGLSLLWCAASHMGPRQRLAAAAAHDDALAALTALPEVAGVQGVALGLLHALSAEPRPCAAISAPAGLRAVCASLGRHAQHAGVQRAGCAALSTLAVAGGAATCSRIRAEGGVRVARAALRRFSDAEVVRAATAVLRALAAKLVPKPGEESPAPKTPVKPPAARPQSPEPTAGDEAMGLAVGGVRLVDGKWVLV